MHVGVDEGGRYQSASNVDFACGTVFCRGIGWFEGGEVPILNGNVDEALMTVEVCLTDDKVVVHMGEVPPCKNSERDTWDRGLCDVPGFWVWNIRDHRDRVKLLPLG